MENGSKWSKECRAREFEFFFSSLSKRLAFSCLCKFLRIWLTLGGQMGERRRRMTPIGAADRCVELAAPLRRWGEMRKWKRDQWKAVRDGWEVKGGGNVMEARSYLPSDSSPPWVISSRRSQLTSQSVCKHFSKDFHVTRPASLPPNISIWECVRYQRVSLVCCWTPHNSKSSSITYFVHSGFQECMC